MKCPKCGDVSLMIPEGLSEKEVRFCPLCGKNLRYNCTNCNGIISRMGVESPNPDEIRCPDCHSLFYVCEKCGRLVDPDQKNCPECGGMLLSYDLSSYTYNGTGFYDKFTMKLSLDNNNKLSTNEKTIVECDELYSVKIIGGYLFVWHDSVIDKFDISNFKYKIEPFESIPISSLSSSFNAERSNISPCMALLGDNIILASKEKFLWFANDEYTIDKVKGIPKALISGHCGVAMWTEYEDNYHLYIALCPKRNNAPEIIEVKLPDTYELSRNSPYLAMTKTKLYWQGKSGNIYSYNFVTEPDEEPLKEIFFDGGKISKIWTDSFDRVSVVVIDSSSDYKLSIYDDIENSINKDYPSFDKSVSNIYVYKDNKEKNAVPKYAYILSNEIMKNGTGEYKVSNGEHVQSIFTKEDDTIALLSLFNIFEGNNHFVNIFAQKRDAGLSTELIWKTKNIEPIELMCYKDKIFVIHKKGIIAIEISKNNYTRIDNETPNNIEETNDDYFPKDSFEEIHEDLPTDTNFDLDDLQVDETTKSIEETKKKFDTNKLPKETLPEEEMNKIKLQELLTQLKSKNS